MSYSMHLGILYDKSPGELRKLRQVHQAKVDQIKKDLEDMKHDDLVAEKDDHERSVREIDDVLNRKRQQHLARTIVVTEDHVKLIQAMEFKFFEDGGDYVFIGVEGKRPWGNSDWYGDIAQILEWKLPNDSLSDKQRKRANQLIEELPHALNKILRGIGKDSE